MKWHRLAVAMALASTFLIAQCPTARADDANMGAVGSSVMPMENDQVSMAAERIDALIRGEQAYVTCVFTFTNAGPAASVLMGFPRLAGRPERESPELLDFTAEVDGKASPVTFKPQAGGSPDAEEYAGWYTFSVPFAEGQTRTVRNTYHGIMTIFSNGDRAFEYVLETGAGWLGPIGRVDVTVRWLHDRDVLPGTIQGMPSGYEVGDRVVHWHSNNLEPTSDDNILAFFRPANGLPNSVGWPAASSGDVLPSGPTRYLPPLFGDNDPATAWRSSGEAAGAWLAWLDEGYPVSTSTSGIGILPGAAADNLEFRAHGRPRQVLVKFAILKPGGSFSYLDTGEPSVDMFDHPSTGVDVVEQSFTLKDLPTWQFIILQQRAEARAFKVIVQSVYPGSRYDDVAISEILFPLLPDDVSSPPAAMPVTGLGTWQWTLAGLALLGLTAMLAGVLVRRRAGRSG